MKVLVTGATGFIGSHLCGALLKDGHQVRVLHRTTSRLDALEGLDVERVVGDITVPESLPEAVRGVEVLFHAAAQLGSGSTAQGMHAATYQGTRNVLEAARQSGVRRVVHTSSVAALGVPKTPVRAGSPPALINENHTWNEQPSRWRYGYSKYLAEMAVQEAVAHGLDVVIVNPAVVIGPGDANRISNDILIQVAKGRVPVAVPGGLNAVSIHDVVRGHLAALEHGRRGERYILAGENLTHNQFLTQVAEVVGRRPPQLVIPALLTRSLVGPVGLLSRVLPLPIESEALYRAGYFFYYDTLKAHLELGWKNEVSVRQALKESFDWYRENNYV